MILENPENHVLDRDLGDTLCSRRGMGVSGGPKIIKNMRNRRISMSTCGFKKILQKKIRLAAKIGEFPHRGFF